MTGARRPVFFWLAVGAAGFLLVPWYALRREMNLVRVGSPRSRWYWRAILSADSIASEPPETG